MRNWNLRDAASIYEDVRNIGLLLVGAGILGLAGLGDVGGNGLLTLGVGMAFWCLSVIRPGISRGE